MPSKLSGIYRIRNLIDGKAYIGSAVDLERRLYNHRWNLNRGSHCNIHLQRAWGRDGESNFAFETILVCQKEQLIQLEQEEFDKNTNIYNINLVAGSTLGRRFSDETKHKISLTSKGRWTGKKHTEETKRKISQSNLGKHSGKKHSLEARLKMSISRTGMKRTPEQCARMSRTTAAYWARKRELAI